MGGLRFVPQPSWIVRAQQASTHLMQLAAKAGREPQDVEYRVGEADVAKVDQRRDHDWKNGMNLSVRAGSRRT